ncbi:C69 family dipeptidase [Flexithrix dorotheae]|uniref:C69 family dipeptidase n=1 Tax=Flexithrix dorotheae TaxID=70993 RepID=UPI0003625197|nr:C69 family dipeptidase [Flexithrix dorotheae]
MSDTFIAVPEVTTNGNMIFGKNSGREPNEAQAIMRIPAMDQEEDMLECSYIKIPQVKTTYEVLLSRPFHMWGAEMGTNEFGLTIGNEAVFSKVKSDKKNAGLTGMDMLRVALERCKTADEALGMITGLLEEYGQDAFGGYRNQNYYYNNSFIIADSEKAWVLETVGKQWAAQIVKGFRNISNGYTIEEEFDLHSKDLMDFASKNGWTKKGKSFNFREAYSEWFYTRMSKSKIRQKKVAEFGNSYKGNFDVLRGIEILSSHNQKDNFSPTMANTSSISMMATGRLNPLQTTGSMLVEIRKDKPSTTWLTGTSLPCNSIFKPFFIPGNNIYEGLTKQPSSMADESFWWQSERFNRLVLKHYQQARKIYNTEREKIQKDFISKEKEIFASGNPEVDTLNEFSEKSFTLHKKKILEWKYQMGKQKLNSSSIFYTNYLKKLNREAHLS